MTGSRRRILLAAAAGLVTGVLAALLDERVRVLVMLAPFAAAAVIDVRTRRIPNALSAFTLTTALASAAASGEAAGAAGGALVALLAGLALYAGARGVFGMGDVKLMAGAGAASGLAHVLAFLFAMALAGGAVALVFLALRRGARATMPYGPAIAGGVAWLLLVAR